MTEIDETNRGKRVKLIYTDKMNIKTRMKKRGENLKRYLLNQVTAKEYAEREKELNAFINPDERLIIYLH